jgi:hypothetical protein
MTYWLEGNTSGVIYISLGSMAYPEQALALKIVKVFEL